MNLSNYLKHNIIEHLRNGTAWVQPAAMYLALYTAAPGPGGGGTEVIGGAYARQALVLDADSDGITQNTSDITFPTPTASWGIITHGAVFDAPTGGNLLLFGSLQSAKAVASGAPFKVLAGDFDFSLT